MSLDIKPTVIPEQIRCANYGCCCKQSNYDNHPEGKAPPTYVYDMPDDDNNSWVMKHTWFHLCWELGIEEPFYAGGEDEVRALAINVLRLMHEEIFNLRNKLKDLEPEEVEEPDFDTFIGLGGYTNAQVDEMLQEINELYRIPEKDRTDQQSRWIDELSDKLDDAGVHP